jgi:multicomponent Na+:H+ antiporter subunit D
MQIALPLLIPLLTALATALAMARPRLQRIIGLVGNLALLLAALGLLQAVMAEGRLRLVLGGWPTPFGIELVADPLSASLVLVAALLALAVRIYASGQPSGPAALLPLEQGLLAAALAICLAGDLFNLYVWFELMLICLLGLLALNGGQRASEASLKYFALSLLGTLLMLAAIGLIYGATGQLNFTALGQAAHDPALASSLSLYTSLLIAALLLKAAAFPLFAWLPASYHCLHAPQLALVGGLLTKLAAYVILRLLGELFVLTPAILLEGLGWLALATMLSGVLGAAYHWDMRRILAFHIVSQIGYLLLGIALASPAGAVATGFFLLHNILVKANLFLIVGLMILAAGHHDLRRIGGLYPASLLLAGLFFVNAFALVGVPPTTGFWGKFLILREAFAQGRYLWGGMALAVGLLTLYSMSKIWLEGFWKAHPEPDRLNPQAIPLSGWISVSGLTLLLLVSGFYPEPLIAFLANGSTEFWRPSP